MGAVCASREEEDVDERKEVWNDVWYDVRTSFEDEDTVESKRRRKTKENDPEFLSPHGANLVTRNSQDERQSSDEDMRR